MNTYEETLKGMKYSHYLPIIDLETGEKVVLWGGWYTENEDGTISSGGKTYKKWESFPK